MQQHLNKWYIISVCMHVCLWKKPGRAREGENVRVRYIHIFLLRFTDDDEMMLNVLRCQLTY